MTNEISTELHEKALAKISEAEAAYQKASALIVSNQDEYNEAGDFIAHLKDYRKALESERKEYTKPLDDLKKKLMDKFRSHIEAIDRAITSVNQKMIGFYREQERKRKEAEAAAAEKARKEKERLEKRAALAAEKGHDEKATVLNEQANHVTPQSVPVTANKQTAATTIRKTWSAEVYDFLSLIEAVAAGKESVEMLQPSMPALNKRAAAEKESLKIPGVRVKCTETVISK